MNKFYACFIGILFLIVTDNVRAKDISLNFQNIPVRSAIQLLADFGHVNIVINDSVTGNMSLNIQHMSWKNALNIIMKMRSLDARTIDGVIFVAPAEEMIHWDKMIKENQEAKEALIPLAIETIQIKYANADELKKTLKNSENFLLTGRGHMSVDKRMNALFIQDIPDKINKIKEVIHFLDQPVQQVLIEARIVTVNRNVEKDLGIKFGISDDNLSGTLEGANEWKSGAIPSVTERLNMDFGAVSTLGYTPTSVGIALAKLGGGVLLDMELSALESEGEGKVISRPRLITSNQQPAFIESGEEIPYQESTSSGATAVSFKKAVLKLKVTPNIITSSNKVMMALCINQDMPNGILINGVPEVTTKEIQTNVLVSNGQTLVLGGIYRQDKSHSVERIPFLSEIPGIGSIFQKKTDKIIYEELLIFITPKIISA